MNTWTLTIPDPKLSFLPSRGVSGVSGGTVAASPQNAMEPVKRNLMDLRRLALAVDMGVYIVPPWE